MRGLGDQQSLWLIGLWSKFPVRKQLLCLDWSQNERHHRSTLLNLFCAQDINGLRRRAILAMADGDGDMAFNLIITDAITLWPDSPERFLVRAMFLMTNDDQERLELAVSDTSSLLIARETVQSRALLTS